MTLKFTVGKFTVGSVRVCKNCRMLEPDHPEGKCLYNSGRLTPITCRRCNQALTFYGITNLHLPVADDAIPEAHFCLGYPDVT